MIHVEMTKGGGGCTFRGAHEGESNFSTGSERGGVEVFSGTQAEISQPPPPGNKRPLPNVKLHSKVQGRNFTIKRPRIHRFLSESDGSYSTFT